MGKILAIEDFDAQSKNNLIVSWYDKQARYSRDHRLSEGYSGTIAGITGRPQFVETAFDNKDMAVAYIESNHKVGNAPIAAPYYIHSKDEQLEIERNRLFWYEFGKSSNIIGKNAAMDFMFRSGTPEAKEALNSNSAITMIEIPEEFAGGVPNSFVAIVDDTHDIDYWDDIQSELDGYAENAQTYQIDYPIYQSPYIGWVIGGWSRT